MNISNYLQEIDLNTLNIDRQYIDNKNSFYHIDKYTNKTKLKKYDIAILGIEEERNTSSKGTKLAPNSVRQQLYTLMHNTKLQIIDLGNLQIGESLKDTYTAIADLVYYLTNNNILPIIIGGGQDLSYGMYNGLDKYNIPLNIVSIDSKLDIGYEKDNFDAESYLGQIILNNGKNLFNYSNLGHQSYLCSQSEIRIMNELKFDTYRLGMIRSNIEDSEPVLRDAHMLSIDIKSIKQSDAPGSKTPMPNGFYGEEICQLARYAGISDKIQCFGLFELNPKYDTNNQTSALAAQIIWHFIDGYANRENDYPKEDDTRYTKYTVSLDKTEQNIVFFQNNHNKRWWVVVPHPKNPEKNKTIACSYKDYELASKQEIPEKWLNAINKLI